MTIRAPPRPPITAGSKQLSSISSSSSNFVRVAPYTTTNFFAARVDALKLTVTKLTNSKGSRYYRHAGVVLGAHMNLLDRIARIIKSYINSFISLFEDSGKILDQIGHDLDLDLSNMRQLKAELDNQYKSSLHVSEDWYRKAQLALGKGDKDLACEALKRCKFYIDSANALNQQKDIVDNLFLETRLFKIEIEEAKLKKDGLKARAQSSKTVTKVMEMLGNVSTINSVSAFENVEEKVMAMEAQPVALNYQLTSEDLEAKRALQLAMSMTKELYKATTMYMPQGDLPLDGRSVDSGFPLTSHLVEDLEVGGMELEF